MNFNYCIFIKTWKNRTLIGNYAHPNALVWTQVWRSFAGGKLMFMFGTQKTELSLFSSINGGRKGPACVCQSLLGEWECWSFQVSKFLIHWKCQNLTLEMWFEVLTYKFHKSLTLKEKLLTWYFLHWNILFLFLKAVLKFTNEYFSNNQVNQSDYFNPQHRGSGFLQFLAFENITF